VESGVRQQGLVQRMELLLAEGENRDGQNRTQWCLPLREWQEVQALCLATDEEAERALAPRPPNWGALAAAAPKWTMN